MTSPRILGSDSIERPIEASDIDRYIERIVACVGPQPANNTLPEFVGSLAARG